MTWALHLWKILSSLLAKSILHLFSLPSPLIFLFYSFHLRKFLFSALIPLLRTLHCTCTLMRLSLGKCVYCIHISNRSYCTLHTHITRISHLSTYPSVGSFLFGSAPFGSGRANFPIGNRSTWRAAINVVLMQFSMVAMHHPTASSLHTHFDWPNLRID